MLLKNEIDAFANKLRDGNFRAAIQFFEQLILAFGDVDRRR